MNVEFLIHGTLSDGQSSWKKMDEDYCARFYTPTAQNELMVCEVTKRETGEYSSYYSYLRYNNLTALSGRSGAYFGITVRIDDAVCCDVANIYNLLDTIFNKCIVGTLLSVRGNSYVYTCDSFKSKDTELRAIEAKFGNMCNAMFIAGNDFVAIPSSYVRKNSVMNLNIDDVSNATARETLLGGNKLCVSPYFRTKQMQSVQQQVTAIQNEANQKIAAVQNEASQKINAMKEDCVKQLKAKAKELEQVQSAASSGKAQLRQEINNLKKQLEDTRSELETVKAKYRTKELNVEINRSAKELKEPLMKLAAIMAERFPEVDNPDPPVDPGFGKKDSCRNQLSFVTMYWKKIITAAVILGVAVAAVTWFGCPKVDSLKEKDDQIQQCTDSIDKPQDPKPQIDSAEKSEGEETTGKEVNPPGGSAKEETSDGTDQKNSK